MPPGPLISATEIYDILYDLPFVDTRRKFLDAAGIAHHSALGHLTFAIDHAEYDRRIATIVTVEARYTPYLLRARVGTMGRRPSTSGRAPRAT